jgi:glyoxylase-like metal-dependent hydrolase (beta-lactamase superfamily II)
MDNTVNLKVLALDADVFGTANRVHPVLIWDQAGATLVDAGYPWQFGQLQQAVEQAGVPFSQIRRVVITHQDWDHIGTLPDILAARGSGVEIYAHSKEKPYIEGTLPFIKLTPEKIAVRLQNIPEARRAEAAAFFNNLPTAPVHRTVEDGEILPVHGGLEVIHTPGHTPGHICLYVKARRLLIAGDQLRVENGMLVGPSEIHTVDMPTARRSLDKLLKYEIDAVACYHGGEFGPYVITRISELVRND